MTEQRGFHDGVLAMIVLNAAVMGAETSAEVMARHGWWLLGLNGLVQTLFVLEIAVRVVAHWPTPLRFFRDPWNGFDFTVVALSLLPVAGPVASVARLARLLRVTRLVSAVPDLRLIVATMLRSIPSMGHVILLLGLLLYVYGVLGVNLFAEVDPAHWGSLGTALLTLFQMLTLEGWVEIQGAVLPARPFAWLFFGSFIVVAVFVVINLFIAVVINNLERAKAAEESLRDATSPHRDLLARLEALKAEIERCERGLRGWT
jgi:voltage-gated sodium channel